MKIFTGARTSNFPRPLEVSAILKLFIEVPEVAIEETYIITYIKRN